ncbi:unnamed protein product [Anisakis simplex]|uniref:Uncharacterized protein n=1 Tax=Anisakis simplex TaxID=6269 RepID=A0A0M3JJN6_ANISI|nr:unnamed protein product [Anisakis simplex]
MWRETAISAFRIVSALPSSAAGRSTTMNPNPNLGLR